MLARAFTAVALTGGALLYGLPAVAAGDNPSPWTPYIGEDWVSPAGTVCSFTMSGEVVADKERYRTTAWFADGTPRYQEWTGQLIVRFTNEDTGESATRNLTGRGDFEYFADGSWRLTAVGGHFAGAMGPTGEPGPGWYVVTGSGWSLRSDAEGRRTLTPGNGNVENMCETLA